MPDVEKTQKCAMCDMLRKIKDDCEYFASQRPDKKGSVVTVCKVSIVQEDYIKNGAELIYTGRIAHTPRPINFCTECGRKINKEELIW